ncbi:inositol monophosphatase family protein [Actinophytocola glycyrrhizae]|uniref:Inositol monophosphatase family protein n=1 Tax=Actinophytocola glycyrrhizae TaxID=2044873 RepID=A0ABV9RWZ9_9PSEU
MRRCFPRGVQHVERHARDARPKDGFVGEEGGRSGPNGAERHWLVDPLGGTRNFAARTPLVAVNVALHGTGGVLAVTADPFSGEVFWIGGEGAHVHSEAGDAPLRPDPGSRLADLDPPFPNATWFRAVDLLTSDRFTLHPQVLSTSLALVWVADRRVVAKPEDGVESTATWAVPCWSFWRYWGLAPPTRMATLVPLWV